MPDVVPRTPRPIIRSLNIQDKPRQIQSIDLSPGKRSNKVATIRSRSSRRSSTPILTNRGGTDAESSPNGLIKTRRRKHGGGEKNTNPVVEATVKLLKTGSFKTGEAARHLHEHLRALTVICGKAYGLDRAGLTVPLSPDIPLSVSDVPVRNYVSSHFLSSVPKPKDIRAVSEQIVAFQQFQDRQSFNALKDDLSNGSLNDLNVRRLSFHEWKLYIDIIILLENITTLGICCSVHN